jgi:hypothetical protein
LPHRLGLCRRELDRVRLEPGGRLEERASAGGHIRRVKQRALAEADVVFAVFCRVGSLLMNGVCLEQPQSFALVGRAPACQGARIPWLHVACHFELPRGSGRPTAAAAPPSRQLRKRRDKVWLACLLRGGARALLCVSGGKGWEAHVDVGAHFNLGATGG